MPLFKRVAEHDREPLPFLLDGQPAQGMNGDTLLTAILTNATTCVAATSAPNRAPVSA